MRQPASGNSRVQPEVGSRCFVASCAIRDRLAYSTVFGKTPIPTTRSRAGDLILNAYLVVGADGTGFGNLNDPVHPEVNSHLNVLQAARHGNQSQYDGQIIRSNNAAWLGQPFSVTAIVQDLLTALTLTVNGQSFSGKGLFGDGKCPVFCGPLAAEIGARRSRSDAYAVM